MPTPNPSYMQVLTPEIEQLVVVRAKVPCSGATELFFGPRNERQQAREIREAKAKEACMGCVALIACREHAMTHPEFGVWGGMTEEERFLAGAPVPRPLDKTIPRDRLKSKKRNR